MVWSIVPPKRIPKIPMHNAQIKLWGVILHVPHHDVTRPMVRVITLFELSEFKVSGFQCCVGVCSFPKVPTHAPEIPAFITIMMIMIISFVKATYFIRGWANNQGNKVSVNNKQELKLRRTG